VIQTASISSRRGPAPLALFIAGGSPIQATLAVTISIGSVQAGPVHTAANVAKSTAVIA